MSVTEKQLRTAMRSMFDLLGVDPARVLGDPGISVGFDGLRFHVNYREAVVPGEPEKDWPVVDAGFERAYEVHRVLEDNVLPSGGHQ